MNTIALNSLNTQRLKLEDKYLTVGFYKEPLKKIPEGEGVGYLGVLLSDLQGKKLLCNICGNTFDSLGLHIYKSHNMKAKEYKVKFQLSPQTALISDSVREKKQRHTLNWLKNMSLEERTAFHERRKERFKEFLQKRGQKKQPKITLETMNKKGTCPDQILAKVEDVIEQMGKVPTIMEFTDFVGTQRWEYLIHKIYGGWKNVLRLIGKKPKGHSGKKKHPYVYDQEELLEHLRIFAQENRRLPRTSDFRRYYLPDVKTYTRNFGTLENARNLAGCHEFID